LIFDSQSGAQRIKLLLVDDDHRNLIALRAVLSESLYDVFLAYSGTEALELASRNQFAVILLDVQMPGMDGFETARLLKALEGYRDTPLIFVTAFHPEPSFVRKGYAVGAIDYFTKPLDPEVLRIKVDLYCALQQKDVLLREREARVRQMEELLRAERKLSLVLETHPIGILIADVHGELCQINEEASKLWGPSQSSHKGNYSWAIYDEQLFEAVNGPLARVLRTGQTSRNEFTRYTRPDGTNTTVLTTASALRNLEGTVVGAVVVIQDLTEHRHIEQDMVQRMYEMAAIPADFGRETQH